MISLQTSWSLSKPHDLSPNLMISLQTSWSLSKPHDLSPNLMIFLQTSQSLPKSPTKMHDLSPTLTIPSNPHDLSVSMRCARSSVCTHHTPAITLCRSSSSFCARRTTRWPSSMSTIIPACSSSGGLESSGWPEDCVSHVTWSDHCDEHCLAPYSYC